MHVKINIWSCYFGLFDPALEIFAKNLAKKTASSLLEIVPLTHLAVNDFYISQSLSTLAHSDTERENNVVAKFLQNPCVRMLPKNAV